MSRKFWLIGSTLVLGFVVATIIGLGYAQNGDKNADPKKKIEHNTYLPIVVEKTFEEIYQHDTSVKDKIMKKQNQLLIVRYDLSDNPSKVMMSGGRKLIQKGVRVKLPKGMTWQKLAEMTTEEIKAKNLFPMGFRPLPHAKHK